ncbi:L-dopachrome tautomerase-related protein [Cellulophaga fucicola]|uniref:Major royal jelly protein n=1 Tax=Cellulophaga fucicola TaxID=76595 RepID=A0A1K1R2L3_9FLAO|nr:L-dopachrome tautomerase-related protein [Cellulophaga fucicola]SFW65814.1 Major royal jelly protein [Cellulophaga fucicola]
MKNLSYIIILSILFISCKEKTDNKIKSTPVVIQTETPKVTQITSFKGQQVTGISVSNKGRIFVNFPRWRKGVANSVLEISKNTKEPFPNKEWNSWEIGDTVADNKFVGVQSVVAFEDLLYVLDTRSALFQEVVDAPRVFVFNLKTNALEHTYILNEEAYHPNSYINDLRVDKKNNKIYFTDSGNSGLVILDVATKKFTRVLDHHSSTEAEQDFLTFADGKWSNTVHSDGIALDTKNDKLYYHALTGYSLYSIPTAALSLKDTVAIKKGVTFEAKTSAPDGMIFDNNGILYYADLENNKIMYRKPDGSTHILIEGDKVKWADTFSIYNNYLYYTNSRINEVTADISAMDFTVHKIELPTN